MKATLHSRFGSDLDQFLIDGVVPMGSYQKIINDVHTKAVSDAIVEIGNNIVLGAPAPAVHRSESQLPRPYRSTLSQLRSNFCN